jgi:hypothetical protein
MSLCVVHTIALKGSVRKAYTNYAGVHSVLSLGNYVEYHFVVIERECRHI